MKDIEKIIEKIKSLDLKNWDDLYTFLKLRDEYFYDKKILPIEVFNNIYLDHELNTSLKDILSDNLELKLKAAKYLERISRMETDNRHEAWLKDPRTNTILYKALDDEDLQVFENVSQCMGNIISRYKYNDYNAFDKIVSRFDDVDDRLKIRIAQTCSRYPNDKKWKYIIKALDCRPLKDAISYLLVAMHRYGKDAPLKFQRIIKVKMLKVIYDEKVKNRIVKAKALEIANLFIEKSDIEEFTNIIANYNFYSVPLKNIIERKITELESFEC